MSTNPQRAARVERKATPNLLRALLTVGVVVFGTLLGGLSAASPPHATAAGTTAWWMAPGTAPVVVPNSARVVNPEPTVLNAADWMPSAPSPSASSAAASPGCSASPCPMGVVDYGVKPSLVTYSYNTTAVEGFADVSSLTVSSGGSGCLDSHASYCMGFQSNWIDTGVYVKNHHRTYWTQDVAQVGYDSSCSSPCVSKAYSVTWLDNIWNFSYSGICPTGKGLGCMNSGDLTGNGKGACSSSGGAPTFYYCVGPTVYGLTMPFTIWTFMSTGPGSVVYGPCGSVTTSSCVDFYGAIIENNSFVYGAYYDSVSFTAGSLGGGHPVWLVKSANSPFGLPYDAEWVMCGPSSGASITLGSASVLMENEYYSSTSGGFISVKHAWSSGADTAESVKNANLYAFSGFRDVGSAVAGTENPQTSLW
jgi:hypothetical protein